MGDFTAFREKMERAEVREAAILAFERAYGRLVSGESGLLAEEAIEPSSGIPAAGGEGGAEFSPELLGQTVVIKLNGGLGTSMGLQKAKSLLEVKDGKSF
ncbi:MAG: UTP--glucose-1-phosphate uridylyltransferase, partial [Akkermansiaceae bacterium]|nr:UTP--glucose-1-phosphate uridylyltransferase [Akkermansiaceae bacterium]